MMPAHASLPIEQLERLLCRPPDSFGPSPCCGVAFETTTHDCGCIDGRCLRCGADTYPLQLCAVCGDWDPS